MRINRVMRPDAMARRQLKNIQIMELRVSFWENRGRVPSDDDLELRIPDSRYP